MISVDNYSEKNSIDRDDKDIINGLIDHMHSKTGEYGDFILYYRSAIMEVETKLNVLNEEFMIKNDRNPISSIHSRLKTPYSIKEKLLRKNQPFTFEAMEKFLSDIAGIRVVCSFPDDVYLIADALTAQDDVTLIKKKDYIKNPKENGYRSLHLIIEIPIFLTNMRKNVKVEIQLRTIAMDCWAALEHQINYKKGIDKTPEIDEELRQCAELSAQLDFRMNEIRKKVLCRESEDK